MDLGQLPAERQAPVSAKDSRHVRQCAAELVGCLIEDHGALFLPQLFQVCGALVAVHGEKALKGKACGDNAAGFAGKDAVGDALRHRQSAVFVIADDGRVDVIMGQELSGHTGVLCRQKVHLTQQPQLTHGDVLQVADGCADDV